MSKGKIIYMVVPCYNEEEVLDETTKQLSDKLQKLIDAGEISEKSRILYVNDGRLSAVCMKNIHLSVD